MHPKLILPRYQSHRGYHVEKGVLENTLLAFRRAKFYGFEACEMDLRLAHGNQVVVHHDETLLRVYKQARKVSDLSGADLTRYGIARLEEVLADDDIPDFLNLEIKSHSVTDFSLEQAIAETFRQNTTKKQVMFSSFNPWSLWKISKLLPMIPRALLVTFENEPGNRVYLRQMWFAPFVDFQMLNLDYRSLDRALLYAYQKKRIPLAVWTLNDEKMARQWLDFGVVSIITDTILPDYD